MTPRVTIVRVRPHAYKGGAHCYDITIREGLRGMTIPVLARSGIQAVTVARAVFDDAILAAQSGLNIEHCINHAWHEIKDRKGRMVDGVFVKEADL